MQWFFFHPHSEVDKYLSMKFRSVFNDTSCGQKLRAYWKWNPGWMRHPTHSSKEHANSRTTNTYQIWFCMSSWIHHNKKFELNRGVLIFNQIMRSQYLQSNNLLLSPPKIIRSSETTRHFLCSCQIQHKHKFSAVKQLTTLMQAAHCFHRHLIFFNLSHLNKVETKPQELVNIQL